MGIKVSIEGVGDGVCSLTGKQGEGLTVREVSSRESPSPL